MVRIQKAKWTFGTPITRSSQKTQENTKLSHTRLSRRSRPTVIWVPILLLVYDQFGIISDLRPDGLATLQSSISQMVTMMNLGTQEHTESHRYTVWQGLDLDLPAYCSFGECPYCGLVQGTILFLCDTRPCCFCFQVSLLVTALIHGGWRLAITDRSFRHSVYPWWSAGRCITCQIVADPISVASLYTVTCTYRAR